MLNRLDITESRGPKSQNMVFIEYLSILRFSCSIYMDESHYLMNLGPLAKIIKLYATSVKRHIAAGFHSARTVIGKDTFVFEIWQKVVHPVGMF